MYQPASSIDPRVASRITSATTEHLMAYVATFARISADPGHAGWDDAIAIHDVAVDELIRRGVMRGAR